MNWSNVSVYGILHRLSHEWRNYELRRVGRRLKSLGKLRVANGPFKGLQMCQDLELPKNLPKLTGSYEEELHLALEHLISMNPSIMINVGAAEGYYAVGLAVRCPHSKVYAFETDKEQRERCRRTAALNGVLARMSVNGECTAKDLSELPLTDAVIVMDCEGGECDLITEETVPRLRRTFLVVELHDCVRAGCGRVIQERLSCTHDLSFIPALPRDPSKYAFLDGLNVRQRLLCVTERRLGMQEWLFASPKAATEKVELHVGLKSR